MFFRRKVSFAVLAVVAVMFTLITTDCIEAKTKMYMIEKLSDDSVEVYNYKWDWETGYKPRGKAKKLTITDKTKFYILPENAALGVDYDCRKVPKYVMRKEVESYIDEGWHMFATVKFKKTDGQKTVVSVTEELQDW